MKRMILPILLMVSLSACAGAASTPTPIPTLALTTAPASEAAPSGMITASAVVIPLKDAQLSFPAAGRVQSVDVQVGDKVTVGQALITLDTALLEARVREAEANLKAAQIQVQYLKRVGTDEHYMDQAIADADRAQALLDSAKATLDLQSKITAPFDGTVVSVDVNAGETVVPGRPVVTLSDLSKYLIQTTDLSERDVTRVKVGQSVTVSIDALDKTFSGKVTKIDLVSSTLGGDVVFTVTIELDEQPEGLLWGMSADVQIQAD